MISEYNDTMTRANQVEKNLSDVEQMKGNAQTERDILQAKYNDLYERHNMLQAEVQDLHLLKVLQARALNMLQNELNILQTRATPASKKQRITITKSNDIVESSNALNGGIKNINRTSCYVSAVVQALLAFFDRECKFWINDLKLKRIKAPLLTAMLVIIQSASEIHNNKNNRVKTINVQPLLGAITKVEGTLIRKNMYGVYFYISIHITAMNS